jgi:hypothetical protein
MSHWFDRVTLAAAEPRISRRDALRRGGALAAATAATAVLPAAPADASDNAYCLAACLDANDNGFNRFTASCQEAYLGSNGFGSDAIELINCLADVHRAFKAGVANCGTPFCGNKKRYPPRRRPPIPRHVKPPKPPPASGPTGGGGHGGIACGSVRCDPDDHCCYAGGSGGAPVYPFCLSTPCPT